MDIILMGSSSSTVEAIRTGKRNSGDEQDDEDEDDGPCVYVCNHS